MLKIILSMAIVFFAACDAFSNKLPYFKKNDRVAVIGDSITHYGYYHLFIEAYIITRFPRFNIKFYNKGVSSDTSWGTLKRYGTDIMPVKPTAATIMLGMNDIWRSSWSKEKDGDKKWKAIRESKLNAYKKSMTELVHKLKESGVKRIILLTPSIYDQTSTVKTKNYYSNRGLAKCRQIVLDLAKKERLKVAEIFNVMMRVNAKAQKMNPEFSIVGPGRIHPGISGHMVMAYAFMKSMKFPALVSKVSLSVKNKKLSNIFNCKIKKLSFKPTGVQFDSLENSLPFPRIGILKAGFQFIPFDKDFNQEILKVTGLRKGAYKLEIDGHGVGVYSDVEFMHGINLALNAKTPMNEQALRVYKLLAERRSEVAKYNRQYFYMRYIAPLYMHEVPTDFDDKSMLNWLNQLIINPGQTEAWISIYKNIIEYIHNKKLFNAKWNLMINKAYEKAVPVNHHFVIEMTNK